VAGKYWKQAEKRIAKVVNGERVSNQHLGLRAPDVVGGDYCIEVKCRSSIPAWLLRMMEQAERNTGQGQAPVLVLHLQGASPAWRHDTDDLVVMRMGDWCELLASSTAGALTKDMDGNDD